MNAAGFAADSEIARNTAAIALNTAKVTNARMTNDTVFFKYVVGCHGVYANVLAYTAIARSNFDTTFNEKTQE